MEKASIKLTLVLALLLLAIATFGEAKSSNTVAWDGGSMRKLLQLQCPNPAPPCDGATDVTTCKDFPGCPVCAPPHDGETEWHCEAHLVECPVGPPVCGGATDTTTCKDFPGCPVCGPPHDGETDWHCHGLE